ncbi:MAG: hypothetical protein ACTHJ0_01130 [Flavipsychrobacter sp.]
MKLQLSKLEREIAINIQSRKINENGLFNTAIEQQEVQSPADAFVVRMTPVVNEQQQKGKLSLAMIPQRTKRRSMGL